MSGVLRAAQEGKPAVIAPPSPLPSTVQELLDGLWGSGSFKKHEVEAVSCGGRRYQPWVQLPLGSCLPPPHACVLARLPRLRHHGSVNSTAASAMLLRRRCETYCRAPRPPHTHMNRAQASRRGARRAARRRWIPSPQPKCTCRCAGVLGEFCQGGDPVGRWQDACSVRWAGARRCCPLAYYVPCPLACCRLVDAHNLSCVTVRCFDVVTAKETTGGAGLGTARERVRGAVAWLHMWGGSSSRLA